MGLSGVDIWGYPVELIKPVSHCSIDEIWQVTRGNYVIESERFQREVAGALGRRVTRGVPGRPTQAEALIDRVLREICTTL